ncbi:MFS transporter [Macrococcoides canis]|uniref:Putative MFS family arabinose efflux permease n=1 Tax=Abyssicoccus albus TaxID=1817405 RepID=A0A3N5BJ74_9BACL|nr:MULTISPECIES: MFS transporter [Staphylococcaceae]RPF57707.1 putative MFS family arabinose efflux permease [Abyssicoccus albus]TDM19634.1 MFS transporter [Macrococcus canis]TDM22539.1 MFS transporter [Macrococcus canis]TDM35520.1 MFS transporter [Macrococcus canis]
MTEQHTSIFKNKTYMLLLLAGIFAVTGFSMFLTTTSWYVIRTLGMPEMLGLVLIVVTVPRLVMMIYGGVLADNYKKSTIMFGTNITQAVLLALITIFIFTDIMTLGWFLVLAGLFGMLDAFFGPASTSMIPKIVERRQLQKANAYFQGVDQISFLLGPMLAGVIMEFGSVTMSFMVGFILVILSAVFVFPPLIKEGPVENTVKQTPLQNFTEGFNYVRKSNFLIIGIIVLVTLNFFVFGTLHIAVPFLTDLYGGTPINLSIMEMSLSLGMLIGTVVLGSYYIKRKGAVAIYGLLVTLIIYIVFSFVESLSVLPVLLFFIGLAMSFVFIPFFTATQEITENRMMGRVMSLIFLAMNGFDPIAYAIVGILTSIGISIQLVLLGFGIIGLIITLTVLIKAKEFRKLET